MFLTPEERRKVMSKQMGTDYEVSSGRNSVAITDRLKPRYDETSDSSSTSSHSDDENAMAPRRLHPNKTPYKVPHPSNNVTSSNNSLDSGDYRIRRSR